MVMEQFESTIEVNASPNLCYQKWRRFEEFPHFMQNVQVVSRVAENCWHWEVSGPLGHRCEWDAEMDGDEPNTMISWHSLSGSEIDISGIVYFMDLGDERTQVTCQIQYEPPAGALGELVAHLFSNPEQMVAQDLQHFKELMEGTNVPLERVNSGRKLQPAAFTTASSDQTEATQTANAVVLASQLDEEDYERVYGLEDDLPAIGTSANITAEDVEELTLLAEEESPYIGLTNEGALYSEDLIDMRNDQLLAETNGDVFTESMDIDEEDLSSYIEGLDGEVDAGLGLGPRETSEMSERTIEPKTTSS